MYAYRPGLTTSIVDRCCGRRSHRLSITGHVVYRVGVGLSLMPRPTQMIFWQVQNTPPSQPITSLILLTTKHYITMTKI